MKRKKLTLKQKKENRETEQHIKTCTQLIPADCRIIENFIRVMGMKRTHIAKALRISNSTLGNKLKGHNKAYLTVNEIEKIRLSFSDVADNGKRITKLLGEIVQSLKARNYRYE